MLSPTKKSVHDALHDALKQYLCPVCSKKLHIPQTGFCSLCGEPFADTKTPPHSCGKCMSTRVEWDSYNFLGFHSDLFRLLILHAKFHASNAALDFFGRISALYFAYQHAESLCVSKENALKILSNKTLTESYIEYPTAILSNEYCSMHKHHAAENLIKEIHINNNIQLDTNFPHIIIPMPLHPNRLFERGYNQCTQIAKHFTQYLPIYMQIAHERPFAEEYKQTIENLHVDTKRLLRIKSTQPQTSQSYNNRLKNVKNTFAANNVLNKNILLLDDVATTNSTLHEACKTLKQQGAKRVDVLVMTRAHL